MFRAFRSIPVWFGILSMLIACFWNEVNVAHISTDRDLITKGKTIYTADDASYLVPAENYCRGKGFKNNLSGSFAYFMRPPGYSLIYLGFRYWLPEKQALFALKFFQVALFGISVSVLYLILSGFNLKNSITFLFTSIYAFSGMGFGFLYYTISEAITPALVLFFVYSMLRAKKSNREMQKWRFYLISFCLFGFIFIIRPVLGILALSIPVFIFQESYFTIRRKLVGLMVFGILGFAPMVAWQIRAYSIEGKLVGLHPIYSVENLQTPYRPVHQAFWEFAKSWGEKGATFHRYADEFWEQNYRKDANPSSIDILLNCLPNQIINELGKQRIKKALEQYRLAILEQRTYFFRGTEPPKENFASEKKAIVQFHELTSDYRRNHFWNYQVGVPISVLKRMVLHSNLSLYIFQKSYRGNWWMETWRTCCFLIHLLAFLSLPLILFTQGISKEVKWIFVSISLYIFYLIYFQRGIEERYTLPIFPLILVSFALLSNHFLVKLSPKYRQE